MFSRFALFCAAGLSLVIGPSRPLHAKGPCANLLGKQITIHGDVTVVEQWQIGNTKFDMVIARTTEPSCGTIQTTAKARSCHSGMKFVATGQLRAGPASRSAGNKRANATDYGFEPTTETGLCR
jgi:hypothetical protein